MGRFRPNVYHGRNQNVYHGKKSLSMKLSVEKFHKEQSKSIVYEGQNMKSITISEKFCNENRKMCIS